MGKRKHIHIRLNNPVSVTRGHYNVTETQDYSVLYVYTSTRFLSAMQRSSCFENSHERFTEYSTVTF